MCSHALPVCIMFALLNRPHYYTYILFLSVSRRTHEDKQQKTPLTSVADNKPLSNCSTQILLFLHCTPTGVPWPSLPSFPFRSPGQRRDKRNNIYSTTVYNSLNNSTCIIIVKYFIVVFHLYFFLGLKYK